MQRIVFVLACLACVGYGRQPQASDEISDAFDVAIDDALEKAMHDRQVKRNNPAKALMNLLGGVLLSPFRLIKNIVTFPFWLVRRLSRKNIKKLAKRLIQDVQAWGLEPASIQFLSDAIAKGSYNKVGEGIYAVMIDLVLDYDVKEDYDPESDESPYSLTSLDYTKTDDPDVREKVLYLLQYGIGMVENRYLRENSFYDIFEARVVNRMGMDIEEFNKAYEQWFDDYMDANSEQ
jgi:hypothetical protein